MKRSFSLISIHQELGKGEEEKGQSKTGESECAVWYYIFFPSCFLSEAR